MGDKLVDEEKTSHGQCGEVEGVLGEGVLVQLLFPIRYAL